MASYDFESFIRRELLDLRDRLLTEYRRLDKCCLPSSGIESWTFEEVTDQEILKDDCTRIEKPASPAPPAQSPLPTVTPCAAGLPELFGIEVDRSEGGISGRSEDADVDRRIVRSPVQPLRDNPDKADGDDNSSSSEEEFVNHEEDASKRHELLDISVKKHCEKNEANKDKTQPKLSVANNGANGKCKPRTRSVRMSTIVQQEEIEARPGAKNGDDEVSQKLWGLEDLVEGDTSEEANQYARKSQGPTERQKSQRKSLPFDLRASRNSVARRGYTSEGLLESERNGTPRSSHPHFELLPVWTDSGIAAMRKRAFSMRTKSLMLEVDIEKTKEEVQTHVKHPWILHPSSTTHLIWDMFGLLLLAYDCVSIPLEAFEIDDNSFLLTMAWIIRIYWTASILKSFMTGYLKDDGTVEMRPEKVGRRYAVTWLPLDAIVVLVDWAEVLFFQRLGGFQRFGSGLRGLRMIRTVRLIRLIKAPEITSFINEQIRSEQILLVATIAKVIIIMLGVAHVLACAWFGIGRLSSNSSEGNWIGVFEVNLLDKTQQYVTSFHWSLSQFAGELTASPQNSAERVFTVCVLFFAIMVSAWFVSSITTSMTQLQIITSQQSTQTAILRRYLVDQNISRPLALRVQRNAQHALKEQKKNANESSVELLKLISNPLLVELHFEIHGHVLFHHPFFLHYNAINPGGMRKVCHTAVSVLPLHPGDVLFRDLEVPTHRRMFFVQHGGLIYKHLSTTAYVEKGDWMCEAILWTNWTHCGTVKAYTETQLLVLEAEKFQDTISTFPSDHPAQYAEQFIMRLNQAGRYLTDIALDQWDLQAMISEAFPDEGSDSDYTSSDEDADEDEHVVQSASLEDSQTPGAVAARASLQSTKSTKSNKSRKSGRSSKMSTAARSSLAKGLQLLGAPSASPRSTSLRSGSKVSATTDKQSQLPQTQMQTHLEKTERNDMAKHGKNSNKKRKRSSGGLLQVKTKMEKSMKHTRQTILNKIKAVSHHGHGPEHGHRRGSSERHPHHERHRGSSGTVCSTASTKSTTSKGGWLPAIFHRRQTHDPPPPPVQTVTAGGQTVTLKQPEDPHKSNAWSQMGSHKGRLSPVDPELQDLDVVPMGRPGSGLGFRSEEKEIPARSSKD